MKKRSLGLTILGWFEILLGIVGFLWASLSFIMLIGLIQMYGKGKAGNVEDNFYILFTMISTISPLIFFIIGIGILRLKKWAWLGNVFLSPCVYIYIYIYKSAIFFEKKSLLKHVSQDPFVMLWFAIPIITIFYLTRPKVRAQFFTNKRDINANHSKEGKAL